MTNLSIEHVIERLQVLINDGGNLLIIKTYEQPDLSLDPFSINQPTAQFYKEVDDAKYPRWRIESLATLRKYLGSESFYVTGFEQNCDISPSEEGLQQGIGVLEAVVSGYREGILPETDTPTSSPVAENMKGRIVLKNLPEKINVLVDELNDNYSRNNKNSCALLIRKILTISCYVLLDREGKSELVKEAELNIALSILQKELKISDRIMSKVKSAKWIGDSANHSYKVSVNDSDIEVAMTGLRIFLEEAF